MSFPSTLVVPAAMVIAGTLFVPPAEARSHTATATCAGSQTVTYSPGLTDRPRNVTINGTTTLRHCVSATGPTTTGGTSTFTGTGTFSCTSGTYTGTRKITWSNGRTSTLSFGSGVSVNGPESIVTIKGTVTGGEFAGQKWGGTFTMFTTKPTACAAQSGLTTASGPLLLSIGSLMPSLAVPRKTRPVGR